MIKNRVRHYPVAAAAELPNPSLRIMLPCGQNFLLAANRKVLF